MSETQTKWAGAPDAQPGTPTDTGPATGAGSFVIQHVTEGPRIVIGGAPEGPEVDDPKGPTDELAIITRRRSIGYGLGAASVVMVTTVFIVTLCALPPIEPPADAQHVEWPIAILAAHALVTFGFIVFCYQLLRMGERFSIPYWWVKKLQDISAVLGVKVSPANDAATILEAATKLLKDKPTDE